MYQCMRGCCATPKLVERSIHMYQCMRACCATPDLGERGMWPSCDITARRSSGPLAAAPAAQVSEVSLWTDVCAMYHVFEL
jgi:hypothetical protein